MKSIIFFSLLFYLNPSFADVYETGVVKNIIVEANMVSVWLSGVGDNTECPQSNGRWTVTNEDPLFKEKYSAILAASLAGKEIKLRHLTSNGCGVWGSNKIYFVHLII